MQKKARREALQELIQHLQQMDAEKLGAQPPMPMRGEMGQLSEQDMNPEQPEMPSGQLPIGNQPPPSPEQPEESEDEKKQKQLDELFNKEEM